MAEVETEWTDWYDKFRSLHARLAKAERRRNDGADGGGDGEDQVDGVRPPVEGGRLNQAELAQLVRGRRGLLRPAKPQQG